MSWSRQSLDTPAVSGNLPPYVAVSERVQVSIGCYIAMREESG